MRPVNLAIHIPRWASRSFAIGNLLAAASLIGAFSTHNDWLLFIASIGLIMAHIGLMAAKRAIEEHQQ